MKKYLRLFPVCALLLMVFIPLSSLNAWKIWGQELPSGDAEIQVFWYSNINKRDFRIPQDLDLLELDEFSVYFRFEKVNTINFTVQLYDFSLVQRTSVDPETNKTEVSWTKNYDILRDSREFSANRSQGTQDRRFAVIEITRENFPALKSSNVTQLVQVVCQGYFIEFYHLTNPAEIEIIKKAKEWNMEVIGAVGLSLMMVMGFAVIAVQIRRKLGRAPSPPKWYFWPFLGGFFLLVYTAFLLMQGLTMEMISRSFIMIPWILLPAVFGVYFVFFLLDKFSADLDVYFFLTIKLVGNKLRIGPHELYGYRRKNKLELTIDPDSWYETIKKLFTGGFKPPDEVVNPTIRVDSDNPEEFPHVFPVAECKIQKSDIKKHKPGWKTGVFVIGAFMFMVFPLLLESASLMTALLTIGLFLVSLIVLVINSVTIVNPSIKIDPLVHRSQVAVITEARAVESIAGTLRETLKSWAKDRSKVSADSIKYVKHALKEYEEAYKGIDKDLEIELDEETIKVIKDIQKTLKWSKSKKLVEELEKKLKEKTGAETPMPMPEG